MRLVETMTISVASVEGLTLDTGTIKGPG